MTVRGYADVDRPFEAVGDVVVAGNAGGSLLLNQEVGVVGLNHLLIVKGTFWILPAR